MHGGPPPGEGLMLHGEMVVEDASGDVVTRLRKAVRSPMSVPTRSASRRLMDSARRTLSIMTLRSTHRMPVTMRAAWTVSRLATLCASTRAVTGAKTRRWLYSRPSKARDRRHRFR